MYAYHSSRVPDSDQALIGLALMGRPARGRRPSRPPTSGRRLGVADSRPSLGNPEQETRTVGSPKAIGIHRSIAPTRFGNEPSKAFRYIKLCVPHSTPRYRQEGMWIHKG